MRQIYLLLTWWIGASAWSGLSGRTRSTVSLHGRDTFEKRLLVSRSPTRPPDRSSGPMQRAQNIPESERPRQAPPPRRSRGTTIIPATTASQPSTARAQTPSPDRGSPRSGNTRPASLSTSTPQSRPYQPTIVRGVAMGPALFEMPRHDGTIESKFLPPGRGEFISASGGDKHSITVKTFSSDGPRPGAANLGAHGGSSAMTLVKTERQGKGTIQKVKPSPAWERFVGPDQTDSARITAESPPEHQYLMGNVIGEGKVVAAAESPPRPAR